MRTRVAVLAMLALLLAWPRDGRAQLLPPGGVTSFDLTNVGDPPQILVSVTPVQGAQIEEAHTSRVVVGDKSRLWFKEAFRSEWKDNKLQITANFQLVRSPGVWTVTILLHGTTDSGKTQMEQSLDLGINVLPAKLRPIPPLILRHERWPWAWWNTPVAGEIALREVSGIVSLSTLTIEQLDPTMLGDTQVAARLKAEGPPDVLKAGALLPVELTGAGFPIGTSKGSLTIDGAPLEQPVSVPFEIHTKVHDWIIIVVFALSGLLGWLLRDYLRKKEARAEIDTRLAPLRERVEAQIETHPDPSQVKKLSDQSKAVDDAIRAADDSALKAAVDLLQTVLEAALAERQKTVAEALQAAIPLHRTLSGTFDLPAPLSLTAARARVAEWEAALMADKPKEAEASRQAMWDSLGEVGRGMNQWGTDARAQLTAFLAAPPDPTSPLLPASIRIDAQDIAAAAIEKLAALPRYDAGNPPDPLADYLHAAHAACWQTRTLVEDIVDGFEREVKSSIEHLRAAKKDANEVDKVALAGVVPPRLRDGDPAAGLVELAKITRAFSTAVGALIENAGAKKLLETGQFATAAAVEGGAAFTPRAAPGALRGLPRAKDESPPVVSMAGLRALVLRGSAPVDPVVLSQLELRKIRWIRGTVSAAILSVLAWLFYRASWVGTPQDFAGVAAVGFFTDFTIDSVLEAVTKLKKPA